MEKIIDKFYIMIGTYARNVWKWDGIEEYKPKAKGRTKPK